MLPCFEAGREGAVHSADIKQQIRFGLRQSPRRCLKDSVLLYSLSRDVENYRPFLGIDAHCSGSSIFGAALHPFDLSDRR